MGYNTEELKEEVLKVIKEQELVFFDQIPAFITAGLKTLYNHKLHEFHTIKKALGDNKIKKKQHLQKNWINSKAPLLQIALYKLLADEHEFARLTGSKQEIDIKNAKPDIPVEELIKRGEKNLARLKELTSENGNSDE